LAEEPGRRKRRPGFLLTGGRRVLYLAKKNTRNTSARASPNPTKESVLLRRDVKTRVGRKKELGLRSL